MGVETVLPEAVQQQWSNLVLKIGTGSYSAKSQEWPAQMKGELCWEPTTFKSDSDFTLNLTGDEVSEVRSALQHFDSMWISATLFEPHN